MSFYGQFNTDYYISQYFPVDYIGTCIDCGMSEPISSNNTYHFEERGWTALCIEANPSYCNQAKGIRKIVENVAVSDTNQDNVDFDIFNIDDNNEGAISSLRYDKRLVDSHAHLINHKRSIKVNIRTLDNILSRYSEISKIDFISIDTEDTELDVLRGFDINKWQPKLMVIENNFDEPFIGDYLKDFGYVRVQRIGVNDFFVKSN